MVFWNQSQECSFQRLPSFLPCTAPCIHVYIPQDCQKTLMNMQIKRTLVHSIYGLQEECKTYENAQNKQAATHAFLPKHFCIS